MLINQILFIINIIIISAIIFVQSYNRFQPKSEQAILEKQQIEYLQKLQEEEIIAKAQSLKSKLLLKHLKSYYEQKEYLRDMHQNDLLEQLEDNQEQISLRPFKKIEIIRNLKKIHHQNSSKLYELFLLSNLAVISLNANCDESCQENIKNWFSQPQALQIQKFVGDWMKDHPVLKQAIKSKSMQISKNQQNQIKTPIIKTSMINWGMISFVFFFIFIFLSLDQLFELNLLSKLKDFYHEWQSKTVLKYQEKEKDVLDKPKEISTRTVWDTKKILFWGLIFWITLNVILILSVIFFFILVFV
jgi:hypothetical protein